MLFLDNYLEASRAASKACFKSDIESERDEKFSLNSSKGRRILQNRKYLMNNEDSSDSEVESCASSLNSIPQKGIDYYFFLCTFNHWYIFEDFFKHPVCVLGKDYLEKNEPSTECNNQEIRKEYNKKGLEGILIFLVCMHAWGYSNIFSSSLICLRSLHLIQFSLNILNYFSRDFSLKYF